MKTLSFFILAWLLLNANNVSYSQQKKYNVILICTHDMCDHVGFLGNPEPSTPNFDRLASHGMVFYNNYVQYPLCNPGRTCFMSGWRPDETQVFDDQTQPRSKMGDSVLFIPEYFHQFGYRTERYGHVLHGTYDDDCKWDYAEPPQRTKTELESPASYETADGAWWIDSLADSSTQGGIETQHYVDRLRQGQTQPFFYALGFIQTHSPFAPNLFNWNKNGDPSRQQHLPDIHGDTSVYIGNGSGNILLPQTPVGDRNDVPPVAFSEPPVIKTDDDWRNAIHGYEGDLSQLDTYLGWVLDEIDRQNLWSNTIIVFWTDHGQHLGEHEGLWGKLTLFDESLHIPLIICAPGKKAGVCYQLTENVDVYATLAELCGLPKPTGMEGSSLVPLLDNPNFPWKRAVFSQVKRGKDGIMGRSVHTNQYAYNSWGANGEELYDHFADPNEYTNLATNAAYATILKQMRTILAQGWTASVPPKYLLHTYYKDADRDGYGDAGDSVVAYAAPDRYVSNDSDCNDSNAGIHPGAKENVCNGIDDNCDGRIDEGKPVPIITALGSLDICQTGSVQLQTNTGSRFIYQWKRNGVNINGATSSLYTATTTGTYTVLISLSNGCSSLSKGKKVTSSCEAFATGSANADAVTHQGETLTAYPNPSTGKISVVYRSPVVANIELTIYDVQGKTIFIRALAALKGSNVYELDLSGYASGIYYLKVSNGQQQNTTKVLLQRQKRKN